MEKVLGLFNLHYSIGYTNHTPGDPYDVAYLAILMRTGNNTCCSTGCSPTLSRVWTKILPEPEVYDDWIVS